MKLAKVAFLGSLIIFLSLEAVIVWPNFFYWPLLALNLAIFFTIYLVTRHRPEELDWLNFLILPLVLLNSLVVCVGLLPIVSFWDKFVNQALFVAAVYFFIIYIRNLWLYFNFPERPNNLINFSAGVGFLAFWLSAAAIFGLQLFLNLSYLTLILILAIVAGLLAYENLVINNLKIKDNWWFALLVSFITLQIGWALYFLPFVYSVLALVLALIYYVVMSVIRLYLLGNLQKRTLKPLLIYIIIILALVFLTIRWR
jgi:hypothetical protein